MKLSKQIKPPLGFTIKTVTYSNGLKKLVAISEKSYRSPKAWNGKKWVTLCNAC